MDTQGVDDEVAGLAPLILDHVNTTYADSLLLVGRVLGERRAAVDARAVGVDAEGMDLVVRDGEGEHPLRVAFPRRLRNVEQFSAEAFAVVRRARMLSGEEGETSAERAARDLSTLHTHLTRVSAVHDVHPGLRRITFAGGDLGHFAPLGPDTFLYVLLPPPGHDELTVDASFTWDAYREMPEELRPVGAYYTVRAWRPEVAELDMLFALHEPAGPASAWAARARPGDSVALWGPREAFVPPPDTGWYLLVADETALPAVAAIVESLPAGTPVTVVAEADGPGRRLEPPAQDGLVVHWVDRAGRAPGTLVDGLVEVVRALERPSGPGYVWGGGESRAVTAVRRHVRDRWGMPRERVSVLAYWRHADATGDDEHDID